MLKRHTNIVLILILLTFFYSCGSDPIEYVITGEPKSTPIQPKTVKIFLETSMSMKGYVNSNQEGNYKLKQIVPYFITDIKAYFPKFELYTITDKPEKYNNSEEQFNNSLRNGSILGGKSSKLNNIFNSIIDSLNKESVSFLVSDCILDLGSQTNNITERDLITHNIYEHIKGKNISVAVFQFYSDFNGTYYYDRNNTGGTIEKAHPYYNQIMKKRPFYIWAFGNEKGIKDVVEKEIIKDYENIYFYNIKYDDVKFNLLSHPRKGNISITPSNKFFSINEVTKESPVTITLGFDFSRFPTIIKDINYLQNNLEIAEKNIHSQIEVLDIDKIKAEKDYEKKIEKSITENNLTHFVKITFDNLKPEDDNFQLILKKPIAPWVNSANLEDDLGKPIAELENKTFSFKYLVDAFERSYKDEYIFKINFTNPDPISKNN